MVSQQYEADTALKMRLAYLELISGATVDPSKAQSILKGFVDARLETIRKEFAEAEAKIAGGSTVQGSEVGVGTGNAAGADVHRSEPGQTPGPASVPTGESTTL